MNYEKLFDASVTSRGTVRAKHKDDKYSEVVELPTNPGYIIEYSEHAIPGADVIHCTNGVTFLRTHDDDDENDKIMLSGASEWKKPTIRDRRRALKLTSTDGCSEARAFINGFLTLVISVVSALIAWNFVVGVVMFAPLFMVMVPVVFTAHAMLTKDPETVVLAHLGGGKALMADEQYGAFDVYAHNAENFHWYVRAIINDMLGDEKERSKARRIARIARDTKKTITANRNKMFIDANRLPDDVIR